MLSVLGVETVILLGGLGGVDGIELLFMVATVVVVTSRVFSLDSICKADAASDLSSFTDNVDDGWFFSFWLADISI